MWGVKVCVLLVAFTLHHGHGHHHQRIDWAHAEENCVQIEAINDERRRGE